MGGPAAKPTGFQTVDSSRQVPLSTILKSMLELPPNARRRSSPVLLDDPGSQCLQHTLQIAASRLCLIRSRLLRLCHIGGKRPASLSILRCEDHKSGNYNPWKFKSIAVPLEHMCMGLDGVLPLLASGPRRLVFASICVTGGVVGSATSLPSGFVVWLSRRQSKSLSCAIVCALCIRHFLIFCSI